MATVTKSTLKTYFEQGDIPTQAQYVDLIDSQLNLSEVGTQVIQGNITTNSAEIDHVSLKKLYIPGIGVSQDASPRGGMKVGSSFTIGKSLEVVGDVNVTGNISGSNINSSGTITSTGGFVGSFSGNANTATLATNATNLTGLTTTVAELNFLDGITANEATQIQNIGTNLISAAEWGYVAQNNQHISTTSSPRFAGLTLSKVDITTSFVQGETISTTRGPRFFTNVVVPTIQSGKTTFEVPYTVEMEGLIASDTILCSANNSNLQVGIGIIQIGEFQFFLYNPTNVTIGAHTAKISCVVL